MNHSIGMYLTAWRRLLVPHSAPSVPRIYCFSSFIPSNESSANARLFVAGLSWSVDEKSLQDAFSSFGSVSEVRIVYDKNSGRSRGFGFVHFSTDEEARSAKDAMDGKALLGRPLRISFALDKVRGTPMIVPRFPSTAAGSNN